MSNIDTDILQIGTGIPYNNIISSVSGTNTVLNQNKLNIDFEVRGTGLYSSLYYDASAGRLGIGTGLPDAVLHVIAPCAKDGLIVESISNCPTGVTLLLLHNPQTTPLSGSFPATINLAGRDNNYNEIIYGQIKSRVLSPTSLSTSGEILFLVDHTGVNKEVFVAGLTNLILGGNNQVSGYAYEVLGQKNIGSGNHYIYIGSNNSGTLLDNSILIGNESKYSGPKLFAIANKSTINGSGSFVLGSNNSTSGVDLMLCGSNTTISGSQNLLLANNSLLNSSYVVGIVQNGSVSGISGIVLGSNVLVSGNDNISIGNNNISVGNNSTIVGSLLTASGNRGVIFGNNIFTSGNNLIAIGSNQLASGINNGIFIGNDFDLTNSQNVLYVGFNNSTESGLNNSVIVGANNDLDNGNISNVVILGQHNLSNIIDSSVVIGNTNNVSGTLKNNIVLGSGNAILNSSYNNIVLGALNNQTGVYINSQGETSGNPSAVNSTHINSISIGTNNISMRNDSNIVLGNKNNISGTNLNLLGSFNIARNTSGSYIVGNSNYIEGDNTLVLGKNILSLGKNIIAANNSSNSMNVFGSGSIVVGNNRMLYSGIAIGQNNNLYGVSGLIYGNNNSIGFIVNSFTFSPAEPSVINIRGLYPDIYKQNDMMLLQITNPTGPDNLYAFTISESNGDPLNQTTRVSMFGTLNIDSGRLYRTNTSFDDNNLPITLFSGFVIPLYDNQTNKYYGLNNITIGQSNNIIYSNNITLGNKNISSGNNSIVIGNNISGVSDNSVHIGSSNSNKLVLDNQSIVLNTGTSQESIIVRGNDGSIASHYNLISKNLGLNTILPRSTLDVSGTLTASSIRMGLSSISGYVLTSDASGIGSWQFPVNLSGTDNGILYKISEKVASGIEDITFIKNNITSGLNFYNNIYILNTGMFINPERASNNNAVDFIVWGSGGEFAPKLLEVLASNNITNMFRLTADSGGFQNLSVSEGIRMPTSLTGTFLYVTNSGHLLSASLPSNSILFGNSRSWASGNRKFRWIDNQSCLAVGTGDNIFTDDVITDQFGTSLDYNMVLSSNNNISTVFNSRGLNTNFAVLKEGIAGQSNKEGFHILSNGRVGLNTTIPEMLTTENSDSQLFVDGKISAQGLRLTTDPVVGQYLQVQANGNIEPRPLTINASFSGLYPVSVTTNSFTNQVQIGINRDKPDGSQFTQGEYGRTLVLTANGWSTSSGLQVFHPDSTSARGILLGHGGSLTFSNDSSLLGAPSLTNGIVSAGGQFTTSSNRLGSSQFNQFFLRGRTTTGSKTTLTMNWDNSIATTQVPASNNIMRLRGDRDTVWTYRIFVSCLYQTGAQKGGLGFSAEGSFARIQGNSALPVSLTGGGNITKHRNSTDPIFEIFIEPATISTGSSETAINISVSGAAGYTCLWSATALINQIQWPSDLSF